ncbi:MAG: hypothetical protein E7053_03560 [Lentisphaerae bacterium]|nr:hypothetical protein [Lentisphaerota bacterium]
MIKVKRKSNGGENLFSKAIACFLRDCERKLRLKKEMASPMGFDEERSDEVCEQSERNLQKVSNPTFFAAHYGFSHALPASLIRSHTYFAAHYGFSHALPASLIRSHT